MKDKVIFEKMRQKQKLLLCIKTQDAHRVLFNKFARLQENTSYGLPTTKNCNLRINDYLVSNPTG